MKSNDIYEKVGNQMLAEGMIPNPLGIYTPEEKENMTRSLQDALLYYSCQKLFEIPEEEWTVEDIDYVFGRIDEHLSSKEQEDFYQHYVHCMLNFYNNIEGTNVLWEVVEETSAIEPRIVQEGTFATYLQTNINTPNERTALWMNDFLSKKYLPTVKLEKQS